MALSLEVTTEPPPDISERSTISLRTRALARWGADAGYAFDAAAAETYGWIIAQCGWVRGCDYDRMIAAHAISSGSVLVTSNMADFRGVVAADAVSNRSIDSLKLSVNGRPVRYRRTSEDGNIVYEAAVGTSPLPRLEITN
jgi:hypothetical protein